MILLYRILTILLYPFFLLIIFIRKTIKKEDEKRYKEKIFPKHFNIEKIENKSLIWFHAASIGEIKSIFPIIQNLNNNNDKFQFLITSVTLGSSIVAEKEIKKFKNVLHRFYPLDSYFIIKRFLTLWKPKAIFLVDSEVWPNLLLSAKENQIPVAIINARITKKTFNRWMIFPRTAKKIFGLLDLCLSSNKETAEYLRQLKARNVSYTGNMKLIQNEKNLVNNDKNFKKKTNFWLAASTHQGEELFCLKVHEILKKQLKTIKTAIAPRHLNRVNDIENLCKKFNLNYQVLENDESINSNAEIVIINSFGILNRFFKESQSVFIGKSLIKKLERDSGQSPIEAAFLNCKIYHGPYVYNFQEIYNVLSDHNISKVIQSPEELAENINSNFKNSNEVNNAEIMNFLSKKTLDDTLYKIKTFLKYD